MKSSVCEYFENCQVAKRTGRNCADYENCQTYKFYQKYPEHLGIGACCDASRFSQLEKECQEAIDVKKGERGRKRNE